MKIVKLELNQKEGKKIKILIIGILIIGVIFGGWFLHKKYIIVKRATYQTIRDDFGGLIITSKKQSDELQKTTEEKKKLEEEIVTLKNISKTTPETTSKQVQPPRKPALIISKEQYEKMFSSDFPIPWEVYKEQMEWEAQYGNK